MSANIATPNSPAGAGSSPSLLFALAALLLAGCDAQPSSEVTVARSERLAMGGSPTNGMEIKVVVLDGNEYYATRTHAGYWTLCPKLPPK
jgi:hypothetical protein